MAEAPARALPRGPKPGAALSLAGAAEMPGGRAEASHWHHWGQVYHGGPVALCAGTTELTASRAGLRGRLGSRPDLGTQALGEAGPTVARRLVQRGHRSCPSRVHAGCRVDSCLALVNASHLPSTCRKHRGNTNKTKISPKVVGRACLGLCAFGSGSLVLHAHPGRHHLSLKTPHSSLNSHSHAGSSFVQGLCAGGRAVPAAPRASEDLDREWQAHTPHILCVSLPL